MDRTSLCQEAVRSISADRLAPYRQHGDGDELNAVARYLWNTALSKELYPTIQCFEVLLRNAIHDSLSAYYRPNWMQDERLLQPKDTHGKPRDKEWQQVLDAEDSLAQQGKVSAGVPIEPSRLVAELPLGFWTGLFARAYDRIVAIPVMNAEFRRFPASIRNRDALYTRFDRIRVLRNRLFHHEPIWYRTDLATRHTELVSYIGYLSPTMRQLNALTDGFASVHAAGWQEYRARIGREVLIERIPGSESTSP